MPRSPRYRKTLFGALLASLALHALGTPFFARSSTSPETGMLGANGRSGNERVRYAVVSRFSIDPPHPRPVASVRVRPSKPIRQNTPKSGSAPTSEHHARSASEATLPGVPSVRISGSRVGDAKAAARAHGAIALTLATGAPDRPSIDASPRIHEPEATHAPAMPTPTTTLATAEPTAAPTPSPTGVPRVVAARAESGIPPGGWGASFEKPLVADEAALDDLRARYRGARTVRVDVDEAGHATRVIGPANMPSDQRAALEHELLALRYVPAECNGLRCGGTLQLSL